MNVIKTVGNPQKTHEDAANVLLGALAVRGTLWGYIDSENRVVTYATDLFPESQLSEGQERLTLAFRESQKTDEKDKYFFPAYGMP